MRILHVTKKYPNAIGGDARLVYNLEKQQISRGHNVFILTSNCPEIIKKTNLYKFGLKSSTINQDRITLSRMASLFLLFFYAFIIIKKIRPHIIHTHSADLGFVISFPARMYGVMTVNTCHLIIFPYKQYSLFKRYAEKFFLKYGRFNKLIALDKPNLTILITENIGDVTYIPPGIDNTLFHRQLTNEGTVGDKIVQFLFVGRLEEQKGLQFLIQAAAFLIEKTDNFKILLVGDGSERENISNLIKNRGLDNCIKLLGTVRGSALIQLYNESDVFVLPSILEGFPAVLLEACAMGLPVITTGLRAMAEFVQNINGGLIVEPQDPKGLADAMMKMILDEDMRRNFAKNVETNFNIKEYSWENISHQYEGIYKETQG